MLEIIEPRRPEQLQQVADLFREYANWLQAEICLYDFEQEMQTFPAPYVAPAGALFLAREGDWSVGAVGVRRIGDGLCEMKRLYVKPDVQGKGAGRGLALASLDWSRAAGYRAMRLDTLKTLTAARGLYAALGFQPIPPYNDNPPDRVLFFEKTL